MNENNKIISTEESTEVTEPYMETTASAKDIDIPKILGITGGVLALTILGAGVGILIARKRKKKKQHQKTAEAVQLSPGITATTGFAQDIGARESQQDSYCVSAVPGKGTLAVVADGMGGLQNGAEVSGIVTYVFKECFEKNVFEGSGELELLQMLQTANKHVCEYIESVGGSQSGSTVVATYIAGDRLYYISVGDSHIYLMRNGHLLQMNREHTYAYELDERVVRGQISLESALTDRERKCLTSYVGMTSIEHVDRNAVPVQLCKGDKLLLASDGVFGTLSDQEMENALSLETPKAAAEALEKLVKTKQKRGQDNSTSVVVFCE